MAASLGSLVVSLTAETAQFTQSLNRASYTAQKNFREITSFAKTAAGSLAALYGVSSFTGFIKSQIDLADATGKMAQKVGVSVEELSKLQYAAKLADVDTQQLQSGLVRLAKGMGEAAQGTGEANKAFTAMGISLKNTDGSLKTSSQVLGDVADAFAKYEDGAQKTALAVALFGRSGADLIPLLNGGRDAIKGAGDELERYGGVITAQAAKNAEIFNDNLTRLTTIGTAFGKSIANDILPYLTKLTEEFLVARANGLGFLDMLDMGLRFGNYGEQINKINKEIEGLQTRFSIFDVTGGKNERLEQLQKQKKALQELQAAAALAGGTYEDQISRRFMRDEGKVKKPAPQLVDPAKLKAELEALRNAQDTVQRFYSSNAEAAMKAQLDMSKVFMTEEEIKRIEAVNNINKSFLSAQQSITKQFEDGKLRLQDYNAQMKLLGEGYQVAIDQTNEIAETQSRLNGSWEYGASVALANYVNQSRNLANATSGVVTNALRSTEDALFGVVTGSQSAAQAFSSMVTSILKDIARLMIQRSIVSPLVGFLSGAVSSFFTPSVGTTSTGLMTFDGVGYGGGRALGGNVNAGTAYLVGEKGAETFVPNTNGVIVPNNAMGQTNNVVVNVNMENGSVDAKDSNKLGMLIGNVVKEELVRQKRAGGLLA